MLRLGRQAIDIPAGEKHHLITDSTSFPWTSRFRP